MSVEDTTSQDTKVPDTSESTSKNPSNTPLSDQLPRKVFRGEEYINFPITMINDASLTEPNEPFIVKIYEPLVSLLLEQCPDVPDVDDLDPHESMSGRDKINEILSDELDDLVFMTEDTMYVIKDPDGSFVRMNGTLDGDDYHWNVARKLVSYVYQILGPMVLKALHVCGDYGLYIAYRR